MLLVCVLKKYRYGFIEDTRFVKGNEGFQPVIQNSIRNKLIIVKNSRYS